MSRFKFKHTILVPTHQRGALLRETLRGLLLQEHDDYQIVVSNNFSQDETRAVLAEFEGEPRIYAVHTDRKMSMPVHWEFAMDYVEGEYVTILGDDDGVRPDFLAALDVVIAKTGANMIKFKTALYYHNDWPDNRRNRFEYDSRCSNRYFEVNKRTVVVELCNFTNYRIFPNLLQSCFSLDLYRRVKERCGTMFVGAPDWSCPFLLLMDKSTKYIYIDSTLGFGGRSQTSNVAYYESNVSQSQNERMKDFVNELAIEFRFPHHSPLITTVGNFTPAAFSYAKHFYPEELDGFMLNSFEMAKVIQQDIAEEATSKRHRFWTSSELESFRDYVHALPKEQRDAIEGLPGYFSIKGRIRLQLMRLRRRVKSLIPQLLLARLMVIWNRDGMSKYPFTAKIDVSSIGITDGHGLMRQFSEIVAKSDECNKANYDPLASWSSMKLLGQLHLPITVLNQVNGMLAEGKGSEAPTILGKS
jgi:glycosyltransferase involved in cell wall biosynthesis